MKKLLFAILAVIVSAGGFVGIVAARYEPKFGPSVYAGKVEISNLTPSEAARKLRLWWETEKLNPVPLESEYLKASIPKMTPSKFGIVLDDAGTVAQIPPEGFWDDAKAKVGGTPQSPVKVQILFKTVPTDLTGFKKEILALLPKSKPASVSYENGAILLQKEVSGLTLDEKLLPSLVQTALQEGGAVNLPIMEAPKHVSDEQLAQIKELVSTFSTHFPVSQTSRNNNLKVAASKLNGVILLPGERVSFNSTVGQRTIEAGFKEAPVYKNGKHDKGIGGGICQVSTTLFNASLFANLKIVERHNHSLPVAYVPLGRDATVDYGTLDLVLENPYPTPIAISSDFKPGTLTFRILGTKDPTLEVKLYTNGRKDWSHPMQVVQDKSLKPGEVEVVEKGASGHSIRTFRQVFHNGVLEKTEFIGNSYYKGGPRIIAVNGALPAPKPKAAGSPSTGGTAGHLQPPAQTTLGRPAGPGGLNRP
ncbi:MAG: VanW family protein [Armatimonadetes bacterium]|nr:VanW family protein [Armatimonadota bacterium]